MQGNLDRTLLALADPTRRAILHQLTDGEARVTDLAEPFDMSLNAVSKHIRVLERAELVRRRRQGREHLLSINPHPLAEMAGWLETQRSLWASSPHTLESVQGAEEETPIERRATPERKGSESGK